ncbi:MAG: hypothetical protein ABI634_12210 [Acidobacteriota bacterium]
MIEIEDTQPPIDVQLAEYVRLLGYPRGWVLEDRALELATWARGWYAEHGRPWIYARQAGEMRGDAESIALGGVPFSSARLLKAHRDADAHDAIFVAVGAGSELEDEAQRRWRAGCPDEYFFLEVYGSAVVEYLVTMAGSRLCAWADTAGLAVMPHDSPGYPDWTIEEQARLLATINDGRADGALPVEAMESGMLRPKKALLAVFGVTRMTDRVRRLTDLVPCENCAFQGCQFRRAPYRRVPNAADPELSIVAGRAEAAGESAPAPLDLGAAYSVNGKALRRWSDERLTLTPHTDGSLSALFRFDGTTCTNMGRPLEFHYHVTLGPREDGYPILEARCEPAPGDRGHVHMCRYLTASTALMHAIHDERPLAGRPLNDVLTWVRVPSSAGCYCEPASRTYKWGLVLETIHFALAQREEEPRTTT